jgi:hypothetical protein
MVTPRTNDQLAHGEVILDRLAAGGLPAAIGKAVAPFKVEQAALAKASAAAEDARGQRDAALLDVSEADNALDDALESLADALVGARMGKRKNPFATFSKHAPSALATMAYAAEAAEVVAMCGRIARAKPPSSVTQAAASCVRLARGVQSALKALSKPQNAYAQALLARDTLLPAWAKALAVLRRRLAAEIEDQAKVRALLAPPGRVQEPKAKRKAKAKKKVPPTPAAPAAPPGKSQPS